MTALIVSLCIALLLVLLAILVLLWKSRTLRNGQVGRMGSTESAISDAETALTQIVAEKLLSTSMDELWCEKLITSLKDQMAKRMDAAANKAKQYKRYRCPFCMRRIVYNSVSLTKLRGTGSVRVMCPNPQCGRAFRL